MINTEKCNNMDIRLVAIDLDETLFDTQKRLPEENRQVCEEALSKGVQVVIATGRPYNVIPAEALKLKGLQYAICTSGASVYDLKGHVCMYHDPMPRNRVIELIAGLMPMPVLCDVLIDGHAYIDASKLPLIDGIIAANSFKKYFRTSREEVPDILAHIRNHKMEPDKVTVNFLKEPGGAPYFKEEAAAWCAQFDDMIAVSGGVGNLELTKSTATKGAALLWLADRLGLKREQTMAIGDSGNDYDMLIKAGFSVGMANSEPDVLKAVDYVTKSNDENGVAYAIRKFVL
ncbi:MAG: Cof-type HAD-IIB family hydrolase [Lachnospiraceae bacterium]|nr:Cof-type HAD-IIB family hydrolase [Lachnospiraceae bacterium]